MSPSVGLDLLDLSNSLAEKLDSTTVESSSTSLHRGVRQPARRPRDAHTGTQRSPGGEAWPHHQRLWGPSPALPGGGGGHAANRPGERAAPVAVRDHAPARPA